MSTQNTDQIHKFTAADGVEYWHFPWDAITGEIPAGVAYPCIDWDGHIDSWEKIGCFSKPSLCFPSVAFDQDAPCAVVAASRCEVVTEHVEATVMDALDALRANGGKPVQGWKFEDNLGRVSADATLDGVDCDQSNSEGGFIHGYNYWKAAFRPVPRVRIKAEEKPEPKFKVGDLVTNRDHPQNFGRVTSVSGYQNFTYDLERPSGGYVSIAECMAETWTPGYGFTLDGQPVPQPPEGWEIVPEGEKVGENLVFTTNDGWGDDDGYEKPMKFETGIAELQKNATAVRAYARRVKPATKRVPLTVQDFEAMMERRVWPMAKENASTTYLVVSTSHLGLGIGLKEHNWQQLFDDCWQLSFDGGKTWVPASKGVQGE